MKPTVHLLVALLAAALLPACSKKAPDGTASVATGTSAATTGAGAASTAAPASGANLSDPQILEMIGWFVGNQTGTSELQLSDKELDSFLKGMRAAAQGGKEPFDMNTAGPKVDEWVKARQMKTSGEMKDKNAAAGAAYFAKLDQDKAVIKTASGLRYTILTPGTGPTPKPTDTVRVHYTGKFIDGTTFDSSVDRGQPAEFPLDGVIPGWTEGLQKISKGGKMKLYVPSNLAYGDNGRQGMPPASTLIFDVELLDINPAPAPAPAPAGMTLPGTSAPAPGGPSGK